MTTELCLIFRFLCDGYEALRLQPLISNNMNQSIWLVLKLFAKLAIN